MLPSHGLVSRRTSLRWKPVNDVPAGPLDTSTSPESLMAQDFTSAYHTGSDPSLTPPSVTSSLSSSPPRHVFTPEQREFKRQQDRARRDSRQLSRLRRVSSQPSYMDSPSMSPIPDVATSMDLPYSTANASVSLLSESAGALPTQPYMSSPHMSSYSPPLQPLHDPSQAQMFPTPYTHSMQPSYGMPIEYQPNPYHNPHGSYR